MTQYNSLNVKLLNSQNNKLKSAIKNETKVILRVLSNMIVNYADETNFLRKFLLTNIQCRSNANLIKAFQLSKIIQSGGFPGRLLGPFLKTD